MLDDVIEQNVFKLADLPEVQFRWVFAAYTLDISGSSVDIGGFRFKSLQQWKKKSIHFYEENPNYYCNRHYPLVFQCFCSTQCI